MLAAPILTNHISNIITDFPSIKYFGLKFMVESAYVEHVIIC
jgi:hypothetical protein